MESAAGDPDQPPLAERVVDDIDGDLRPRAEQTRLDRPRCPLDRPGPHRARWHDRGRRLPAIIADLHLDLTDAQWVNSLYAVLLAALLLSTGNLADRWGRKRLFLAGLVVFVGGSLLAAAASSGGMLIGARAVQAVGAAFIMPSTLSTVNAVFRGRHRAACGGAAAGSHWARALGARRCRLGARSARGTRRSSRSSAARRVS